MHRLVNNRICGWLILLQVSTVLVPTGTARPAVHLTAVQRLTNNIFLVAASNSVRSELVNVHERERMRNTVPVVLFSIGG
jgi:uncharacterized lipoprotein YajG